MEAEDVVQVGTLSEPCLTFRVVRGQKSHRAQDPENNHSNEKGVTLLVGIEMSFFGASRFFDLLFGIEIFFDLHS